MRAPTILKKGSINTDLSRKYNGERWAQKDILPKKTSHWDRYAEKFVLQVGKKKEEKSSSKNNVTSGDTEDNNK